MWVEEGRVPIRPKNQKGTIVTEYDGLLQQSIDEYRSTAATDSSIRMCARDIVKFGAGSEGYWNNARFLKQCRMQLKLPTSNTPQTVTARYGCLTKAVANAPSETKHQQDGCEWRRSHAGHCMGQQNSERMVLSDGRRNRVLEERGIDTPGMKAADMRLVLGNHADFKHKKTALEHFMQDKGQRAI